MRDITGFPRKRETMPFRSRGFGFARLRSASSVRSGFGPAKVFTGAALGLAALVGGNTASAANYTLTVDASQKTSGLPHFWSACVGTGTASLTLRSDLQ